MNINLVMLNPNKFGGTVTYTAHLYHALRKLGHEVMIYKLGKVVAKKPRDFGYGCLYKTAPIEHICSLPGYTHVTAAIGKQWEEPVMYALAEHATITIHDPNDLGNFTDLAFTESKRIVIIRPNNTSICPNATFIRHPFIRHYKKTPQYSEREKFAVTLSRLGAIKRTLWILEANKNLPEKRAVWVRGHDDRFFTYNSLIRSGKFPDFVQDSKRAPEEKMTFDKELGEAQRVARQAHWLVDLTHIQNDGGGTQYTFLEAIDAGCSLILNKAWYRKDGIWHPGENCVMVGDADELEDFLKSKRARRDRVKLAKACQPILDQHKPKRIAKQYIRFFQEHGVEK